MQLQTVGNTAIAMVHFRGAATALKEAELTAIAECAPRPSRLFWLDVASTIRRSLPQEEA
jgi:hypothetical protein